MQVACGMALQIRCDKRYAVLCKHCISLHEVICEAVVVDEVKTGVPVMTLRSD